MVDHVVADLCMIRVTLGETRHVRVTLGETRRSFRRSSACRTVRPVVFVVANRIDTVYGATAIFFYFPHIFCTGVRRPLLSNLQYTACPNFRCLVAPHLVRCVELQLMCFADTGVFRFFASATAIPNR